MTGAAPRIDALQYCLWTAEVFGEMRAGGLDAVHATVCYHEGFRETAGEIAAWHRRFRDHADRIAPARCGADIDAAKAAGRTAVILGAQNPSCLGGDIGMLGPLFDMGLRVMQLTYNMQSLLGAGHAEAGASGLTRMGREVIAEMERVGMLVDLSHAGPRTAREAIDAAARPPAITHANPSGWHDVTRNVPDDTLRALAGKGGVLGLSLYPHHLAGGPDCALDAFCAMAARTVALMGEDHVGIGSDLCQGRPDSAVEWMRSGRWTLARGDAAFPAQPGWFASNRDWPGIADGLRAAGLTARQADAVMGGNWRRLFGEVLRRGPASPPAAPPGG